MWDHAGRLEGWNSSSDIVRATTNILSMLFHIVTYSGSAALLSEWDFLSLQTKRKSCKALDFARRVRIKSNGVKEPYWQPEQRVQSRNSSQSSNELGWLVGNGSHHRWWCQNCQSTCLTKHPCPGLSWTAPFMYWKKWRAGIRQEPKDSLRRGVKNTNVITAVLSIA